jgi:hypothetical protein
MFGTGQSGTSDIGMGFNLGMFYSPIESRSGPDFQIGIENVYLTASQAGRHYSTLAPYIAARAQLMMFYGSAGFAPFVWRRGEAGPGIDFTGRAENTFAYFAEAGVLYSATPKFSMGPSLNVQWFSTGGAINMAPATTLTFVMRFYFNLLDIGRNDAGAPSQPEYDGWRYIGQ